MYIEFFGFREKPFSIVADPSYLYPSSKHRLALTYLEYGLMDRIGFILLTGEIGTGKTTLIKKLLTQIEGDIEVAVIFNTNVSPDQLLGLIVDEFELEVPVRDKAGCLEVLNKFLVDKYASGHRVLLIVDEAQNLSQEALEEIRMLSNLQTDKDWLVQILLVGQPALRTRLQHSSLEQLSQRIAVSYHLAPLNLEETRAYISHRLKVAGCANEHLFTPEAVDLIFQHSGGTPRTINILCDASLVYGYADELRVIEPEVIEHVIRDKEEIGLLAPTLGGEQSPMQTTEIQGNGNLLHRIDNLEQKVSHLTAKVDWQVKEYQLMAESDKDRLVLRLETMLAEERNRSDKLLVEYNRLRDKINRIQKAAQAAQRNNKNGSAITNTLIERKQNEE